MRQACPLVRFGHEPSPSAIIKLAPLRGDHRGRRRSHRIATVPDHHSSPCRARPSTGGVSDPQDLIFEARLTADRASPIILMERLLRFAADGRDCVGDRQRKGMRVATPIRIFRYEGRMGAAVLAGRSTDAWELSDLTTTQVTCQVKDREAADKHSAGPPLEDASVTGALIQSCPWFTSANSTRRNKHVLASSASDNRVERVTVTLGPSTSHWKTCAWQLGEAPVRRLGRVGRSHRTVVVIRRVAAVGIGVLSASIAAEPSRLATTSALLARVAAWADDWAWLGILVCWCITGICTLAWRVLGDPSNHAAICELLDRFRDGVFGDRSEDHSHHRVTLFKHYGFHPLGFDFEDRGWPWSGWLIPVARSGHTAQKTNVRFLAPDNTDRARGIAGRAWARLSKPNARATAWVDGLPNIRSNTSTENIQEYARKTNVSEKWVKKRLPQSRSLMGFIVETNDGHPWGVLVIDSRSSNLALTKSNAQYQHYGSLLSHLVEGI